MTKSASAPPPSSTTSGSSPPRSRFGLVGGFAGDLEKLERATQLTSDLRGSRGADVGVDAVLAVLEMLPFTGRVELVLQGICESPARDRLLRELFDACFVSGRPSSSSSPSSATAQLEGVGNTSDRSLDPRRYATLRLVVVALPRCGRFGVELFEAYQKTTSTVLFRSFLAAMVASQVFTDAELEAVFLGTVDAWRRVILGLCKNQPHRRHFLGRLVERKLAPLAMLSWANAEAVETLLSSGPASEVAAFEAEGFSRWKLLAPVYLAHFRRRLEAKTNDPIAQGKVFRELEGHSRQLRGADVVELFALCDQYRPMEIAPSVAPGVRAHLEELSARGALRHAYDGVYRALPCERLVAALEPEQKLELLRASTAPTARGFEFAESHLAVCKAILATPIARSSMKRPFLGFARAALEALSEDVLWEMRVGAPPTSSLGDDRVQQTFASVERFLELAHGRETVLALEAVDVWLAMHRRTTPTPAMVARYAGKRTEGELWTAWAQRAIAPVLAHAKDIARKAARSVERSSPRAARSAITSYVGYFKTVIDDLQSVLATAVGLNDGPPHSSGVDLTFHLSTAVEVVDAARELFARASLVAAESASGSNVGSRAVGAVRASVDAMIALALERTSASLSFDPTSGFAYVTEARHAQLAPLLERLAHASNLLHLPALRAGLFALCEQIFERVKLPAEAARLGFVEVEAREGGKPRSFVHYDLALHKAWSATALKLLDALRLALAALPPAQVDEALAGRVWSRYKLEKYANKVPEKKLGAYLEECRLLPATVLADEKPVLMRRAAALLEAGELDAVADGFARLGWLLEAVDACGDSLATREKYLLKHGEVAVPAVRALMEAATSDREPTVRIAAHLALMTRSVTDLAELAATLTFVAQRTRNEAGLHRPALYQWLNERIAAIVALSLEAATTARDPRKASTTELAAVHSQRHIDAICEALEKMLRDDTSRRDTVAKNAFRSLAALILRHALTWDPSRPAREARRRWVACGAQLDAMVVRALRGEEGAATFVWPLQACTMPRERTVPEEWLEAHRAFLTAHFRAGASRFDELRIGAYTKKLVRPAGAPPGFELTDAIDLVLDAGVTPREEWAQAKVFPASRSESTLLLRAKALFGLAGPRWSEVPRLVGFFERMVEALEPTQTVDGSALDAHADHASHIRQTRILFDYIHAYYPAGSLWYEVPLLAKACERLLDASIRLQLADVARAFCPIWLELRAGRGRTPMADALTGAQAQVLISELAHLAGGVVQGDVAALADRRATCARVLLEKTPSAAYVVATDLVGLRDDLLMTFVRRTRRELRGVFDPSFDATSSKESEAQARAPISVDSRVWPNLNGPTMLAYTQDALEEAMTPARSPHSRSAAIARFVQSPASSHFEIIDLLGKLTEQPPNAASASRSGHDEAASGADDARELLLETVILCVFRTDAAWFVLAHLLSPEVIAVSPRTTASFLSNLHSWVPMDKVGAVLRVLLERERRWALPVFLHKSILRMLFEVAHTDARKIFLHEWSTREETRMHPDVRHEMVKLAVGALGGPAGPAAGAADAQKLEIAWAIIEEVAAQCSSATSRPELGPATVFLLFLPTFTPAPTYKGQRPIDPLLRIPMANSEVPDSFGFLHEKWLAEAPVPFAAPAVRDRMIPVLRAVAASGHPYLRVLATCKELTLSRSVAGLDDDKSLDRLQDLLLDASVRWPTARALDLSTVFMLAPEDEYLLLVAPRLFASLGLQILNKSLEGYTEHQRRNGKALEDVCATHPVAQRLRAVFGLVLEALTHVPGIEVEKRVRLARVAEGLISSATEWGFGKALFTDHFRDAVAFLRADRDRLKPLL